jgi:hypothetical protein
MTRWRKGTNDQDGDGRKGGSLPKETTMTKKTAAKKPAAAKTETPATEGSAHTPQTGMEPGASPKEQRAKLNEQFEAADEKARQAIIDETQVGLQVRGY